MYLGPARGATRAVVVVELTQLPLSELKDMLATLGVDRGGRQEPHELAELLLSAVPHAVLIKATPEAAAACRTQLPTAAEEEAVVQALLAAAGQEMRHAAFLYTSQAIRQIGLLDGQLQMVAVNHHAGLIPRVERLLGRRLAPPGPGQLAASGSHGPGQGPAGSSGSAPARLSRQGRRQAERRRQAQVGHSPPGPPKEAVRQMLGRVAELEGRRLADMPADSVRTLEALVEQMARHKMQCGEAPEVHSGPQHVTFALEFTAEDFQELQAAIRALPLPPAPDVPRCAACGAAQGLYSKLRACPCCLAHYCSTACQRSDWPQHSAACKAARRASGTGAGTAAQACGRPAA